MKGISALIKKIQEILSFLSPVQCYSQRWPYASQQEDPHQNSAMLPSWSDSRTWEIHFYCLSNRVYGIVIAPKLRQWRDSCDGYVWYLDYFNASIMVVILYYYFLRGYLWGKLRKGHMRFLCIISYNYMWIFNYLKLNFN